MEGINLCNRIMCLFFFIVVVNSSFAQTVDEKWVSTDTLSISHEFELNLDSTGYFKRGNKQYYISNYELIQITSKKYKFNYVLGYEDQDWNTFGIVKLLSGGLIKVIIFSDKEERDNSLENENIGFKQFKVQ